jgi:hypothetical protein
MNGPYALTFDTLERVLPAEGRGIFTLGYVDHEGRFRVQKVGRDDTDLRARLIQLIGSSTMFKYALLRDARIAFEQECELFHEFRPPSNFIHPSRPAGTDWQCPRCLQFHH